jgi:hypothetical protein
MGMSVATRLQRLFKKFGSDFFLALCDAFQDAFPLFRIIVFDLLSSAQ